MAQIIEWCNENNGFIEAMLSLVGIVISVIAIVISIKTARIPYRKGIKLGSTFDFYFRKNLTNSHVESGSEGLSITAVNVGARDIYLTFLGIAVRDKSFGRKIIKISCVNSTKPGIGALKPSATNTAHYRDVELIEALHQIPDAMVYMFAMDSEGKSYKKRMGNAKGIISRLVLQ